MQGFYLYNISCSASILFKVLNVNYFSVSSNKPVYSTTTNVSYNTRQTPAAKAQTQPAQQSATSYLYSTGAASGNSASSYSSAYNSSAPTTTYSGIFIL